MNDVMLTLGEFAFSISTAAYQELARATDYRWPGQDRFGQDQALQYVGPGGDTITLPGVIYPLYRGGFTQLDALRSQAAAGEPMTIIDGAGQVLGNWIICRIEERQSTFAAAGKPLKIEFTIDLRKFGEVEPEAAAVIEDMVSGGVDAASLDAGGLADKFSASVANVSAGLSSAMNQVNAVAGEIGTTIANVTAPISKAIDTARGLQYAVQNARGALTSTVTALRQAKSLTQMVNAGASAAANASQAGKMLGAQVSNLQSLGTTSTRAIAAVQNAGVQINRLTNAASKLQIEAMDKLKSL